MLSKICKCGSDLLPRLVFQYEYVGFTPASDEESVKKCKLKESTHSTNTESFIFCIDGKKYNLKYCKSKSVYSALIQSKAETTRGFKRLVSDFSIDSETVQKAFLLANRNASESFLKSFQYKILNDITFTNSWKQNNFPKFYLFTSLIKTKFKTEHYIAAKNNAYKRFDSKWGFLRNYFRTEGD